MLQGPGDHSRAGAAGEGGAAQGSRQAAPAGAAQGRHPQPGHRPAAGEHDGITLATAAGCSLGSHCSWVHPDAEWMVTPQATYSFSVMILQQSCSGYRMPAATCKCQDLYKPDIARHARAVWLLWLQVEDAAVRAAKAGPKEIGDVDTDDDMDEAAEQQEYELWKSREMARIRC